MQRPFIHHKPTIVSSPVIFNSPHSGRQYSKVFLTQSGLSFDKIRLSEDFYVDTLLRPVTDCGSVLLEACFPRAFVDVNRAATELDQELIKNIKKVTKTIKTSVGLGVIPRVVGSGLEIYQKKISLKEAEARLKNYYFPYHQKLKQVIAQSHSSFGVAILFDFHSMPHSCINRPKIKDSLRPQVVLGDCFGTSCDAILSKKVFDIFSNEGFQVEMNNPFSGGFITKNYGKPKENVHAIQVEIDRKLYMNETDCTLHVGYLDLKKKIQNIIFELSRIMSSKNSLLEAAE